MVVGDSAAQSNPLLGEGIRHVIEAAWRAAPIAAPALRAARRRAPRAAAPVGAHGRRSRGRAWPLALRANHYVARLDDDGWDRAVDADRRGCRPRS